MLSSEEILKLIKNELQEALQKKENFIANTNLMIGKEITLHALIDKIENHQKEDNKEKQKKEK